MTPAWGSPGWSALAYLKACSMQSTLGGAALRDLSGRDLLQRPEACLPRICQVGTAKQGCVGACFSQVM